jgi:hypothetical protein
MEEVKQYTNQAEVVEELYNIAETAVANNDFSTELPEVDKAYVEEVVKEAEQNKALLAVLVTLFSHKVFDKEQDIRNHQASIPNGFGARTIDSKYITPFLKSKDFPAMAESGWLTRAFEHPEPYSLNYKISMKKKSLSKTFLHLVDNVQCNGTSPSDVVVYMFKLLIKQRDERNIDLAKPHSLSIAQIISVLEKHFNYKYVGHGASRLPTLAIYAAYQCMMGQVARYDDKTLCELESHTSSDARSGQIGDIQVNNADGSPFEGVEIKHKIVITPELVQHAFSKLMLHRTDRYYLLTTANMDSANWDEINNEIDKISHRHGCQVIVNGVYSTLRYYLRLLKDTAEFIECYVELLKSDENVKYPQQLAWNEINSK